MTTIYYIITTLGIILVAFIAFMSVWTIYHHYIAIIKQRRRLEDNIRHELDKIAIQLDDAKISEEDKRSLRWFRIMLNNILNK